MRYFYIFKINKDMSKIMKDNSYLLYHTLETFYFRSLDDVRLGNVLSRQIIEPIESKKIDIMLFKHYQNNYFYMKYKNIHKLHDVYRRENTELRIYKTYLKMKTDAIRPRFFDILRNQDLFVCDFLEKDYFWIDSLERTALFI